MKAIKIHTLKHFIGALITFGIAASVSTPALAQEVLRISAIPDEAPTELQRKFKPLGETLLTSRGTSIHRHYGDAFLSCLRGFCQQQTTSNSDA